MPKIQLKPQSPEFEDAKTQIRVQLCDMPGCNRQGEFKAPKDRELNTYYWFCEEHIREYNKAWDYFDGMSATQIEEHIIRSATWDRPTWKFGSDNPDDVLKAKAWQTYHGTDEEPPKTGGQRYTDQASRNTPEFEALAIMGLEPPVDLVTIKTRYKELAKKHHPDRNHGDPKSEELLKSINMAYTILKLAYEKYDELPEEKK